MVVELLAVKPVGGKHAGQFPVTEVSTLTKPAAIITPPPSKISQLISPGHEPGTQLEVDITSPVPALKATASKVPEQAAPAKTTTPLTETSTEPPFHPSP